jgi:hypothetical protein
MKSILCGKYLIKNIYVGCNLQMQLEPCILLTETWVSDKKI